jgi:hypothetical protein
LQDELLKSKQNENNIKKLLQTAEENSLNFENKYYELHNLQKDLLTALKSDI